MPWPTEVPIFNSSMIATGNTFGRMGSGCYCTYRWLHLLFTAHSPEWKQVIRKLGSLLSDDRKLYDMDETGEMTALIMWHESTKPSRVADVLNQLMNRLGYDTDA